MASDARPGRSRHFRGGLIEDDHVYAALIRDRDEARERERRALAGRNEAMDRLAEAARERDEARAEVAALLVQLSEARDELDALRELADAAARRIALREAVAMPERVTAGEAFAAEGIPPGDMLGDREWLREYRAARALRGGGGHE